MFVLIRQKSSPVARATFALVALVTAFFIGRLISVLLLDIDSGTASFFYNHRSVTLTKMFLFLSGWGSVPSILVIAVATVFLFFIWKRRWYIVPFVLSGFGSVFASVGLKMIVGRARPAGLLPYYIEPSLSFPSGHATAAAALYLFLIYVVMTTVCKAWARWLSIAVFLSLLFGVTISRVYLDVHFLSDVVGGLLLGSLSALLAILFTERSHKRTPISSVEAKGDLSRLNISALVIAGTVIICSIISLSFHPILNPLDVSLDAPII